VPYRVDVFRILTFVSYEPMASAQLTVGGYLWGMPVGEFSRVLFLGRFFRGGELSWLSVRKITGLYVWQLRYVQSEGVPPWLTHTHTHTQTDRWLSTSYI